MKINSGQKGTISVTVLIILISFNLRAPITGVGSVINIISDEFNMSPSEAGMLTTLPLLAFALISPFAGTLASGFGAGRVFIISSAVLMAGIIIRSFGGESGIFAGTIVIGMSIAIGNVLIPAVIKSRFPCRIGAMTSLYTVIMQIVSTFSTAVSVPLSVIFGWRAVLAIWFVPAAAAFAVCIMNKDLSIKDEEKKQDIEAKHCSIYRSGMTWWITAYMGIQSMMFYSFISWLSPMMQEKGYDAVISGYLLSVYVIMGMAGSAALPFIMRLCRHQSATGMALGVMYLVGMTCMLLSSYTAMLAVGIIICGFCSGTCISFSMTLFGFHTSDGYSASRLSGAAQSGGYLIAAAGPVLLGKIFDMTGSWTVPLIILAASAVFLIFAGRVTGRDEIIS